MHKEILKVAQKGIMIGFYTWSTCFRLHNLHVLNLLWSNQHRLSTFLPDTWLRCNRSTHIAMLPAEINLEEQSRNMVTVLSNAIKN